MDHGRASHGVELAAACTVDNAAVPSSAADCGSYLVKQQAKSGDTSLANVLCKLALETTNRTPFAN
jgi:hypothetical protein